MSGEGPVAGTRLPDVDYAGVTRMIPHRFPMLMVDRVVDLTCFERAVGIKNVSYNEPFFAGHFPSDPIMPGVLIIEALAQAAAVLVVASLGFMADGSLVYFMSVEEARFRRPVRPGDQLRLEVALIKRKLNVYKFRGTALVDGQLTTESVFTAKVILADAPTDAGND